MGEYRIKEKFSEEGFSNLRKTYEPEKLSILRDKVHEIIVMYTELEARVQTSEEEWEQLKGQWSKEKSYYLNRIRDL